MHPESAEKIGEGVDHFEVRKNASTVGFWIVRSDGSEVDFSFLKCLRAPSREEEARGAMRAAVVDQKYKARDDAFAAGEVRCPVTGVVLAPETSHVHHEGREFVDLADEFAEIVGGYDSLVVAPADHGIGKKLVDEGMLAFWRAYHAGEASASHRCPSASAVVRVIESTSYLRASAVIPFIRLPTKRCPSPAMVAGGRTPL